MDAKLPDHKVAWSWVVVPLSLPLVVLGVVPRDAVWVLVSGLVGLAVSLPLAIMSLLDWSRTASSSLSRWVRVGKSAARLPCIALGCASLGLAAISPFRVGTANWREAEFWFLVWFMSNTAVLGLALLWLTLGRRTRRDSSSARSIE